MKQGALVVALFAAVVESACAASISSDVEPIGVARPPLAECSVAVFSEAPPYRIEDVATARIVCPYELKTCVDAAKADICNAGADTAYLAGISDSREGRELLVMLGRRTPEPPRQAQR